MSSVLQNSLFFSKKKERKEETISIETSLLLKINIYDNIARGLMRNPNLTRIPSFHQRFRKRPPTNVQSLRFQSAANTKAVPY